MPSSAPSGSESISPADNRYWIAEVAEFMSEDANIKYQLQAEVALVWALSQLDICTPAIAQEVREGAKLVTVKEVQEEEVRVGHDIRALVNVLCRHVSTNARPFVHLLATSADIIDTANSSRIKDCVGMIIEQYLNPLASALVKLVRNEAATGRIGRTHGQHALPITLGFSFRHHLTRVGGTILELKRLAKELPGQFSGAVGGYNALALFIDNPISFEHLVVSQNRLTPGNASTQVVLPEPLQRLLNEVFLAAAAIANIGEDIRNSQRSEIGELAEPFGKSQVGSSTMAHKKNPVASEQCVGLWRIQLGIMTTVNTNLMTDHERDLRTTAPTRTYGEMLNYLAQAAKQMTRVLKGLVINHKALVRNLNLEADLYGAEPAYLSLAWHGHPEAHEAIRVLAMRAREEHRPLADLMRENPDLQPYLNKFTEAQWAAIMNPQLHYQGLTKQLAIQAADDWRRRLGLGGMV